jgi:putative phosphoesterase
LRPEAMAFLRGSDRIIHAGDICDQALLAELAELAPVIAVRGNNDKGAWAKGLRKTERIEIGGISLCAIHDLAELDFDPAAAGIRVVVSGHSHKPAIREADGVLYLNPGSAGPRRFSLPIAAAELIVEGQRVSARIVEFADGGRGKPIFARGLIGRRKGAKNSPDRRTGERG